MNGNNRAATVGMFQEMVAAFDAHNLKAGGASAQQSPRGLGGGGVSAWSDRDALDADEFRHGGLLALDFEAQLDGFPDPFHQLVKRLGLRMAAL